MYTPSSHICTYKYIKLIIFKVLNHKYSFILRHISMKFFN